MEWGVKEKLSRSPTEDILVNYIIEIVTKRENDKMLKKFLIMGLPLYKYFMENEYDVMFILHTC